LDLDASIGNDLIQIGVSIDSGGIDSALSNKLEVPNVGGNEDRESIYKNEDHIEDACPA
jgi:hypothetical protein